MSELKGFLEFGLFAIGFLVFIFALVAYKNQVEQANGKNIHALSFLWMFHEEYYNAFGKKLCKGAKALTLIAGFMFVLWLILRWSSIKEGRSRFPLTLLSSNVVKLEACERECERIAPEACEIE